MSGIWICTRMGGCVCSTPQGCSYHVVQEVAAVPPLPAPALPSIDEDPAPAPRRTSILNGDLTAEIQRIRREEGRDYGREQTENKAAPAGGYGRHCLIGGLCVPNPQGYCSKCGDNLLVSTRHPSAKLQDCPQGGKHKPNLYGVCEICMRYSYAIDF